MAGIPTTASPFSRPIEGMIQLSLDGEILSANSAAASVLGALSGDELMDRFGHSRALFAEQAEYERFVGAVRDGGRVSDLQTRFRTLDRGPRWVALNAWSLMDLDGNVVGYELMFVDVTDRRLVEAASLAVGSHLDPQESLSAFAQVLREATGLALLTLAVIEGDSYRRLFSFGPMTEDFVEGESTPLFGNPMSRVVETKEPVVILDTSLGGWLFDARVADAGIGSYVTLPLIEDDEVFATFNVGFEDVYVPDQRLVDLLSSVAHGVARGVKNLLAYEDQRGLVSQLQELDRLKSEFIAAVAHDLRSPMGAIKGLADALETQWDAMAEHQRRHFVSLIARNTRNLVRFVEDALQLSHLESGRFPFRIEPYELEPIIHSALEVFAEEARRFELQVEEGIPLARGDRERHWQVLSNLFANALKFSPPDRSIEVRAGRDGAGFLKVAVTDAGPGIDDDDLDAVFDKYAQAGSHGDREKGTGLGLYICKQMVEAQGGKIWAERSPRGGSTFSFTIPIAES